MKIVATIEARMGSSRLPGKVLLPVNEEPILKHLIKRLRSVESIDEIVLATTTSNSDQEIVSFADKEDISIFRGSEEDVLSRVIGAAELVSGDVIVEITGDCPIIDPQIIEQAIRIYKYNTCDYVSNAHVRSYPDGMDVQIFSLQVLKKSASMTVDPLDREHVTLHIRNNPNLFSHLHIVSPPETHWPDLGLTLDESEDFDLLEKIIKYFGDENPLFSCRDVVSLLKSKPGWIKINNHISRKGDN
jgi:spore coat polysaccharide biosynthesis protein SpsF